MRKSLVLFAALMTVVATGSTSLAKGPSGGGKPVKTIQFGFADYTAVENSPYAVIRITRNFTGAATVRFVAADGTADSADYYEQSGSTYAFGRKDTFIDVFVYLVDDGVKDEDPETVQLSLSVPAGNRGVTAGAQSTATLTITDNNTTLGAPTLSATRGTNVGDVDLSWTAPRYATSYTLYKWDGTDFAELDTSSGTTYTDDGLTPVTVYSYVVRANADGFTSSGNSNQADSAPKPNGGSLPDDLEDGTQNGYWVPGGSFWGLVDDSGCVGSSSATHAFYYGNNTYCNYNWGDATAGYIISPEYAIDGDENRLTFNYRLGTSNRCLPNPYNNYNRYDVSSVAVSYDGGTTWQTVDACLGETSEWTSRSVRIAPNGATRMMVRFDFSSNYATDSYLGFAVDDIDINVASVETAGDFLVPPGATLSVTDISIGGWDYTYASIETDSGDSTSLGQDEDLDGPGYADAGPVVWVNNSDDPVHARIALRDTWCGNGVTYYSDGLSFWDFIPGWSMDHATVTSTGTDTWHVAINDSGADCNNFGASNPGSGEGNFKADVEIIPAGS